MGQTGSDQVGVSEVSLPPAHDNPPTCACGGPDGRGRDSCLGAIWGPAGKGLVVIKGEKRKDKPSCPAPPCSHPVLDPQGPNPTHVS